jgi:hypothetical protein
LRQIVVVKAGVSHGGKEHLFNITVFAEMCKKSSRRSFISMRMSDLDWRCVANLLGFAASMETGLLCA